MDTLKIGMKDTLEWQVTEQYTTTRGEFKVFSTPSMCLLAEMAAGKIAEPHLKPGQGQVGLTVNIRHMAPTPLGKKVRADATLTAIDRRKLTLRREDLRRGGAGRRSHSRALRDRRGQVHPIGCAKKPRLDAATGMFGENKVVTVIIKS